jgi:hypothetical protein
LRAPTPQDKILRARFCSESRARRRDDQSALLVQKRPCARATHPKPGKISVTKLSKQASRGSKTITKRDVLPKIGQISSNLVVSKFFEQNARF